MPQYFLDLFTPATWESFQSDGARVAGFRPRHKGLAERRVRKGDVFLCYLVKLSRWCGILEATSDCYVDSRPIFGDPDPFPVRFDVKSRVLLAPEKAVPIFEPDIWRSLSLTRDMPIGALGWAKYFRGSLLEINAKDAAVVIQAMEKQAAEHADYPLTVRDRRNLARKPTVRTAQGEEVLVSVPDDEEADSGTEEEVAEAHVERESITVQAQIAEIGIQMGFKVWVPRNDKTRVMTLLPPSTAEGFLDALPLNYDDVTLKTIEQIDVIWLKGRSMARAFEVEHTTAIYSGLLRMADLLALQPNMQIRLHIVAPEEKREKVKREIKRPVFSLLESGPLYGSCTYLPYDAVQAIRALPHLQHLNETVLDEYEEEAID